jgi:hypothetical protein
MKTPKWFNYEISLYKGDDIVDSGTIKELAHKRGVKEATIYNYLFLSSQRGKTTSKRLIAIKGE